LKADVILFKLNYVMTKQKYIVYYCLCFCLLGCDTIY